jgi:hypothetical protein
MAWFRFSDDWNRKPEIRALDDASYRAFQCLIEAAEAFDRCGTVTDDYAMGTYPHGSRRKLRGRVRDLDDRGLVHLLDSADDYHPDCPSCLVRRTEAMTEVGTEAVQKHPLSASTSARSGRTEALLICIPSFFDVAMTPERKREKRQKDAERQQRKRDGDKAAASRRDALTPSRPPVPVPVPKLRINDHVPQSEEPEPRSTAIPSEPSSGTADRDAVSWLREELDKRRAACGVSCKWKPEHQTHLESIVQQASEAEGDTFKVLTGGMDAFFKDPDQRKWRFAPPGLAWGFAEYAAPILEQEATEASARKRVEQDEKLAAMDAAILARDAERKAERKANGTPNERGAEPVAIAELVPPIGAKLGRT